MGQRRREGHTREALLPGQHFEIPGFTTVQVSPGPNHKQRQRDSGLTLILSVFLMLDPANQHLHYELPEEETTSSEP